MIDRNSVSDIKSPSSGVSSQKYHFILDVLLFLVVVSGQALETPACRAHAVYKNTEEPESKHKATNPDATPRIS